MLGFFCPYVVLAKSILQELWLLKVSWEEEVPEDIQQRWHTWTRDLPSITKHPISRRYFSNTSKVVSTTIHGFSDASDLAYGAVTYLRCVHEDGSISTSIIMAKARVRPLKVTTIPKLELQAASLLSQLLVYVAAILKVPLDQVQPWTDSTIVLGGLRKMPHSITEVFVRNRIAAIQEALPQALWRHISSGDNPADIASRGSSVDDLISSSLWWSGPSWLSCPENTWPAAKASPLPRSLPGVKLTVLTAALTPVEDWDLWRKFSSYTQLVRVYAWIQRFIYNCRSISDTLLYHTLTSDELIKSRSALIAIQQRDSYPEVFQWIRQKKTVPGSHALAGMVVYLHKTALVVTGRVRREAAAAPKKLTPLSIKHHLTKLLVETEHKKQLHSGTSILMAILGQTYYIPGLRAFLKRLAKTCANCQQANAKPLTLQMGLLPAERTSPSPPFSVVGMDFAGPFQLKRGHTRKPVVVKAYVCLFICMATKAIHLEVCSSLETEEFLAAFHRFSHRRGTPEVVFSDNGSNFVGARKELKQIQKMLHDSEHPISHLSAAKEIKWHHTPPDHPTLGEFGKPGYGR